MTLTCIVGLLLAGCEKPAPAAAPPPPPVTVSRPVVQEVTEWDEYPGRLAAVESVEVRPRVGGVITSATFEEGAIVQQGTPLFVIDRRPYEAELHRAEAELQRTQAQLRFAEGEFKRIESLRQQSVATEQEFYNARQAFEAAQAAVAASNAAIEAARLNLEFATVTSPIAGRVGRKLVTPGNLVTGGTSGQATLLTTITSIDPIYCYFDVDERTVRKYQGLVQSGARASARTGTMPAWIAVVGEAEFSRQGHIDFVDNRVTAGTGTLTGRGVFPNADGELVPGFYARVRIPGRGPYRAVLVPEEAIGTTLAQTYVLVAGPDDTTQLRPVVVGAQFGRFRAVEGIDGDARVVLKGLATVRPGMKVNVTEAPITDVPQTQAATPATRPSTRPSGSPSGNPAGNNAGGTGQ